MNMDITKIQKAAQFLGKETDFALLKKMSELEASGSFFITFWGHYSAGKSRLINSILERDLLPVQTRETTAALTYIKFGDEEKCVIIDKDGKAEVHPLEKLKNIFQNTDDTIDLMSIDHIEVFINCDLLKNGLVIVDTPGMNTIIQYHQELAVEAIRQSGKIFYVLGGAPTDIDRKFIQMISGCGVEMYFVRTKCDQIQSAEENADESIKKEKSELCTISRHDVFFVPVSNERDSIWFGNINIVRNELSSLSSNLREEMEKALKARCEVFVHEYLDLLKKQISQLTSIKEGKVSEANANISSCQQRIAMLESMVNDREKHIKKNIESAKKDTATTLEICRENQCSKFSKDLENLSPSDDIVKDVTNVYEQNLQQSVEKFHGIITASLDGIVAVEQDALNEAFSQVSYQENAPTYMEVEIENAEMLDRIRQSIEEQRNTIEHLKQQRQNLDVQADGLQSEYDQAEYDAKLAELDEQYAQIPTGTALRMKENKMQPSSIFKKIGQAIDLALLLIPGNAIAKGAGTIVKGAKLTESGIKTIKAIDTVRDITYATNQLTKKCVKEAKKGIQKFNDFKKRAQEEVGEESKSVLDALSVEFWAEKLGKHFDPPPTMEIDIEEENLRNQARSEILAQQQAISREKIEKRKEMGLIKTHQQELDEQIAENNQALIKTEQELERCKAETIKKARKLAFNKYASQYEEYFSNALNSLSQQMFEAYFSKAEPNIVLYMASKNKELVRQIQEEKARCEKLMELTSTEELDNVIEQSKMHLNALEAV